MKITETSIPEVLIVKPDVYSDDRGSFFEMWHRERYMAAGFPDVSFVQDNCSWSSKNVLRGLHFQLDHPQGKLVQVVKGAVFDVVVDIRAGSLTFGQWVGCEISDENHFQLWVPPGFAHAFCVLSDVACFTYKCTDTYRANDEGGILWNDPNINIDWPITDPILSDKDQKYPYLLDIDSMNLPEFSAMNLTDDRLKQSTRI